MSKGEFFNHLSARVERAFKNTSVDEALRGRRAIIGPPPEQLSKDAEKARQDLKATGKARPPQLAALEQAVRLMRPALPCNRNGLTIFPDVGKSLFTEWVTFGPKLLIAQRGVARVEMVTNPSPSIGTGREPLGTGFLVAPNLLMTACHVLDVLSYHTHTLERGQAVVDFEHYNIDGGMEQWDVIGVIDADAELDLALLEIERIDPVKEDRAILTLSGNGLDVGRQICVVGYPLEDRRSNLFNIDLIYEGRFGLKHAAIGEVIQCQSNQYFHDCCTLGGNSGSPVFNMMTGEVCGVHVSGAALTRNAVVRSALARDFIQKHLREPPTLIHRQKLQIPKSMNTPRPKTSLKRYIDELKANDPEIRIEMEEMENAPIPEHVGGIEVPVTLETIVLKQGRPVLDVKNSEVVLEIEEIESQVWKSRLHNANAKLSPNIPAVGRIEIANFPGNADWIGTGWMLRHDIVVTNRHVASVFAQASSLSGKFRFSPGLDGTPIRAGVDFLEEFDSEASYEFPIFEVLHIESGGGPDLAFLRVEQVEGKQLPKPVTLASTPVQKGAQIAVIGYPARDDFFPNPDLMDRIFKGRYDKKRLAPGLVTGLNTERLFHDCSTLGGNSGAEIVSLETGDAVALHFAGTLFTKNHAVPAEVVGNRLDDVLSGRTGEATHFGPVPSPKSSVKGVNRRGIKGRANCGQVIEATLPINIRISLGETFAETFYMGVESGGESNGISLGGVSPAANEDDDFAPDGLEARPEDYEDRKGYESDFLGADFVIPRPVLTQNKADIVTYEWGGETRNELDYMHFSVLMSESRRLCRFSACNIDGLTSIRRKRVGWRYDPRIPQERQIRWECYGNAPKFSRGHMTRREDPNWGGVEAATIGNKDSMHVTNAVPQIQPFNAGIWLSLEDYALDNCRDDDMRISVFTGPYLETDDPVRDGVQIPLSFWKVIAFIHDDTGALSATGYQMSQEGFIGEEEFVFGQHENRQCSIAEIEEKAGISFGLLADVDPLRDSAESITGGVLTDPRQIRFI